MCAPKMPVQKRTFGILIHIQVMHSARQILGCGVSPSLGDLQGDFYRHVAILLLEFPLPVKLPQSERPIVTRRPIVTPRQGIAAIR